ncbi:MAG TPA: aminotransferase class V-fold PLP-dependent enzyme [Solirubrobacteraceae bacterium]|nr:aminotransferase class V-fold PLP-dependent enzyme [Solirubrobacteraceae bacterium]
MDPSDLRRQFPVLADAAYLNAGTDGPLAADAVRAADAELAHQLRAGRTAEHFKRTAELRAQLRERYASLLHCAPEELSLSTCTTEGIAQVVGGLGLAAGEEILTSDEEHPGLQGALVAAKELRGVTVREVPLARIAQEIGPATRLVACSHVGWMSGTHAPAELAEVDVPVLFDGAQGAGAVPVDVGALGCDAYAAAGQKWLCGPDGTGMLYLSARLRERVAVDRRGYANMENPGDGLGARLHADSRRLDALGLNGQTLALAVSAFDILARAGWNEIHDRAADLAERLVGMLQAAGRAVAPRGRGTLVAFASADPAGERERLAAAGVMLRDIPGRPWLRASVGAWNDDADLERLIGALDA